MNRVQKYFLVFILALLISTFACVRTTPRPDLVFTPDTLAEAQVGVPYEVKISVSRNETPTGDFSISEGDLPKGLKFEYMSHEDSARIYGIPEEAGTFKFKVNVWCYGTSISGQVGEREYTIEVK